MASPVIVLATVIVLGTMMGLAGSVLTLRHMRRARDVAELVLLLEVRDALLREASLAALPIALRVQLPLTPWSPPVLEITGRVPTRELGDAVVQLAKEAVWRRRAGIQTAARVSVDRPVGPRARVLIAEDDPPSLNGLEALLKRWGCEVETATDGQMALEKALAHHPSLVITDVTMPRLNGLEMLKVLRRNCPETPVIMITGQEAQALGPLLPAAGEGPYGYLEKPVEVPELRMLVAKALAVEFKDRLVGSM
jgi:CheY-like chemotaxis protein